MSKKYIINEEQVKAVDQMVNIISDGTTTSVIEQLEEYNEECDIQTRGYVGVGENTTYTGKSTKKNLNDVFELQKSLQKRFKETENIGNQTVGETAIAAQRNLHAFLDEFMEFMNALGGEKDGIGKNAWKYWGKRHNEASLFKIDENTPQDLYDLKMEYIDMFHFFINWGLMIGMTGQEVIDLYVVKNEENFKRQDEGYDPANK